MNISAIGTKSRFTFTGEPVSTSGASTMWLLEASSRVCPSGARARHRHAADRARAARHVLQHEALAELVLEIVGVEAEFLPGPPVAVGEITRTLRDGQPPGARWASADPPNR